MSSTLAPGDDEASEGTLSGLRQSAKERVAIALFIGVPFLALLAAVPEAWGWGLGWRDLVIAAGMYLISGHGITVGFHRFFTHGAFKAPKALKVALAIAGSLAVEGPVIRWVADHRRHHRFSDKDGDPHSPWRYGETIPCSTSSRPTSANTPRTCSRTARSCASRAPSPGW
jgi:stearoyl-CoA desaturase (delta-9 desaturase)